MRLILARHGNTFGPGDTPVWVGAREDLPLTDKGRIQSVQFGLALKEAGIVPSRILAGPLKRTAIGAQLLAAECGFEGKIAIEPRLREIDYGSWGGRSDAEIAAAWGEDAIRAWRDRSVMPQGAGWSPDGATITGHARAILDEIANASASGDTAVLLSSNGILRFFHALLANEGTPPEEAKMGTGHWGLATHGPDGWQLHFWNTLPHPDGLSGVES
ncbi:MAG: histidine phosphatase family protein [Caulobacterales bacterium]|uniref:histidine phosphatase family protein n=1 Tax=Glycocaulis sp. TaxID=1969725 RepID=UPI003F9FC659